MVAFPPVFVFFQHILRQGAFARFGPFVRSVEIEPPLAPALSPNTAPPARGTSKKPSCGAASPPAAAAPQARWACL